MSINQILTPSLRSWLPYDTFFKLSIWWNVFQSVCSTTNECVTTFALQFIWGWRICSSDGTRFNCISRLTSDCLHLVFPLESFIHSTISLDLFNLSRSVLINKVVDMHIATTNSDLKRITGFNLDTDFLLSKLVDSFRMSNEHNLHLIFFWESIDVVSKDIVDIIIFLCNIDSILSSKEIVKLSNFTLAESHLKLWFLVLLVQWPELIL